MAKCNPNSVIQIATNEVGYLEKASNSQLDSKTANAGKNNYTKYNRDYNAWGGGGAQPMEWCASFLCWCFVMAFGLAAAKALLCGGVKKKSYKLTSTYIDGYGRPDYASVESGTGEIHAPELGERILREGDVGEDVKALQENLVRLNYDVGKYSADGEFGPDTEDALKAYQKDHDLEVDGEYGPLSHESMMAELDKLEPDNPETPVESEKPEIPEGSLTVAGGSWNVRTGPGTDYASVAVVHGGDKLAQVPSDGWTPILLKDEIRWISNKALEERT